MKRFSRRWFRFLSSLLAVCLLGFLLTSCGLDGNSGGDSVSGEPSSTAVPSQTETAATTTATLPTQRDVSGEQTQTVGSVLVVEIPAMNTTTSCVRRRISTPPWSAGRGRACRASARYMPWWSPPVSISSCRTVCVLPALFRPGGGDPLYVRLYERRHDGRPVRRCNPTGMNTCTSVPTTTGPLWGPIMGMRNLPGPRASNRWRWTDTPSKEFPGFLGAFLHRHGQKARPWPKIPIPSPPMSHCNNTTLTFTDRSGNETPWQVITDVSGWASFLQIQRLHRWRQPLHPHRQPGSERRLRLPGGQGILRQRLDPLPDPSLSGYPCDRLPVLQGSIVDFAADNRIPDVLFINNISATRSQTLVDQMDALVP